MPLPSVSAKALYSDPKWIHSVQWIQPSLIIFHQSCSNSQESTSCLFFMLTLQSLNDREWQGHLLFFSFALFCFFRSVFLLSFIFSFSYNFKNTLRLQEWYKELQYTLYPDSISVNLLPVLSFCFSFSTWTYSHTRFFLITCHWEEIIKNMHCYPQIF